MSSTSVGPITGTRTLDFARSAPYFAALLGITLVAFWPTYLSLGLSGSSAYIHFHAVTATIWVLFLIAQPAAIRARRLSLHRTLGRASYALAPIVLLAMFLLAHNRLQGLSGEAYALQTYFLYLQLSLAALFAAGWGLGIAYRDQVAFHARFMIGTGLTLIDPVVIRLLIWADPTPSFNFQWLTFGLTDLVLVILILAERNARSGRAVFPWMLGVFIAAQAPALAGLTQTQAWQDFARWFAALPLT